MLKYLAQLLKNLLGDSVGRVLSGAGLSLVSMAALLPLVTSALNAAASAVGGIGGIGGDVLNVILLFGFGEALSVMGAAMLTRMSVQAAGVGLKKASAAP